MHYKNLYQQASFMLSVNELTQLPPDKGVEIVFSGCSNVGKSSAINAITCIKGLARSSKTPGRTQMLNLFRITDQVRLIDLPGYGYAKVSLQKKEHFQTLVNQYLKTRDCLKGLILLMDIRHPMKESDQRLIQWTLACEVPLHILLTKSDKLNYGAAITTLQRVERMLHDQSNTLTVQLFSSLDNTGLDKVYSVLNQWSGI